MVLTPAACRAGTAIGIVVVLLLALRTVKSATDRSLPEPVVPRELQALEAVDLPFIGSLSSTRQPMSVSRDPFRRALESSPVQVLDTAPVSDELAEMPTLPFEALGTAALGDGVGIALIRYGDSTRLYRSGQAVGDARLEAVHDGFVRIALGDSVATVRVPK